jgi:hypothetical protein
VVGVVKDMVMESPYAPVKPTIFAVNPGWAAADIDQPVFIGLPAGRFLVLANNQQYDDPEYQILCICVAP